MTMNSITAKLQRKNIRNSYMLIFCIMLSVILVTSYAVMYLSPTVQNILPIGGDSRKQVVMIFIIAVIGCALFTTYASSLFFKYKSHEFGIFMALGEKKKYLKRRLLKELVVIVSISSLFGLALSLPISYGIWKLFQIFIVDTQEMRYQIGFSGFLFGVLFCIFVILCIFITGSKFIKRSNIIEIMQEQRKTEKVNKVRGSYGILGWILIVSGVFLGYAVPAIVVNIFKYLMPPIWHITYGLTFIGIYLVMLYTIMYSKKGKNPKKYYQNIISTNMMRFSGKQTVKNMCVITLLIGSSLFAAFYAPLSMTNALVSINSRPIDYTFFYKATENQIKQKEIYKLADKNKVKIKTYYEVKPSILLTDGYNRTYDDNNKLISRYVKKIGYSRFFSESEFNRVSKKKLQVDNGQYYVIGRPDGFWIKANDMSLISSPIENKAEKISFAGIIEFDPFTTEDEESYVISDEDYAKFSKGLTDEYCEKFILFNVVKPEKTYSFAKELRDQIILRSSQAVAVSSSLNEYEKEVAESKGKKFDISNYKVKLSPKNTQLFLDWKYYPQFNVLNKQDLVKNLSVFLMLFIYMSIICFTAVVIISYTRSVMIAIDNKYLFADLKKLGANNRYIERVIKKQLMKIFMYPTAVGGIVIFTFITLMLYGNGDDGFTIGEIYGLGINLIIMIFASVFMYSIYRVALAKVKQMVLSK